MNPPKRRRRGTPEPQPLGSLSRNEKVAAGTEKCAACGSSTLTRVPMTLADGTTATFVSCQDCEERVWVRADGAVLSTDAVIERPEAD